MRRASRGGYLGGSTIIVSGPGFQPVRCFKQPGSGTGGGVGPERERQKRVKREQEKETRSRIKENEKLLRKLSKQWIEEKGRGHFEKLTAERHAKSAAVAKKSGAEVARGNALALALERALAKQRDGK